MTYTAQGICEVILDLREDGYKRKAVDMIIENNIDGSDLFFALEKRGDWNEAGLVGIITLMNSVQDQMRDEIIDLKSKEINISTDCHGCIDYIDGLCTDIKGHSCIRNDGLEDRYTGKVV